MVRTKFLRKNSKLHCSFCGLDEDTVSKLIGSKSGSMICNSCVELCNGILEGEQDRSFADWSQLETEELLGTLRPASEAVEALQDLLFKRVDALREREVSWARIGTALGVSRQAAWERFS